MKRIYWTKVILLDAAHKLTTTKYVISNFHQSFASFHSLTLSSSSPRRQHFLTHSPMYLPLLLRMYCSSEDCAMQSIYILQYEVICIVHSYTYHPGECEIHFDCFDCGSEWSNRNFCRVSSRPLISSFVTLSPSVQMPSFTSFFLSSIHFIFINSVQTNVLLFLCVFYFSLRFIYI